MMDEGLFGAWSSGICPDCFKRFNRIQTGKCPGDKAGIPSVEAVPVFARGKMANIFTFGNDRIDDIG